MQDLNISNLVVAQFLAKDMTSTVPNWRLRSDIPYAESCARQIWYGHEDSFKFFPLKEIRHNGCTLYFGADAYKHLLELKLGMLSEKYAETNIAGQFYKGWEELHNKNPEEGKRYDKLIQNLTADFRLIKSRVLDHYQQRRHELVARDLSGINKGDKVLVVGHYYNENVSNFTEGLVRVLTSKGGSQVHEITVTNPDDDINHKLNQKFSSLFSDGRIKNPVGSMPFHDFYKAVEEYDRIFIALPMSECPEADITMIDAWKNRVNQNNTLTHLCERLSKNSKASHEWSRLESFVSPTDIRQEMADRALRNGKIIERAGLSIDACIEMRLSGTQPSFHKLKIAQPELNNL